MIKVLFVCGGNTCRSPMAKVIFEQILREKGITSIEADSAACFSPTHDHATLEARKAIEERFEEDLLKDHMPKSVNDVDVNNYRLILVMEGRFREYFPDDRTFTLKEIAGEHGDIADPYGGELEDYIWVADEIEHCLKKGIGRILELIRE